MSLQGQVFVWVETPMVAAWLGATARPEPYQLARARFRRWRESFLRMTPRARFVLGSGHHPHYVGGLAPWGVVLVVSGCVVAGAGAAFVGRRSPRWKVRRGAGRLPPTAAALGGALPAGEELQQGPSDSSR